MAQLERRRPRFPDLLDWFDEPWAPLLPFSTGRPFRVEDFAEEGKYVLRAELPGLNPDKDVEVSVEGGTLKIHAERHEEHKEAHRSEFRYGSFTRSVTLPEGADTEHITAGYDKGILEVTVPVPKAKAESRRIEVGHA
ncbi:MAG: Hsp20/alpha crystallin family protein [Streptosporangiales bacterium]